MLSRKKNIIGFTLLAFLASNSFAFSQKVKIQNSEANYTQVTILDKGVKRTINIPKDDTLKNKFNPHTAKEATSKEGIIVSFKNPSAVSISNFEERYSLKLKKKLAIEYYIFQNISKYSDVQIVGNIIENETNVKTVKPNWKMKNTPM